VLCPPFIFNVKVRARVIYNKHVRYEFIVEHKRVVLISVGVIYCHRRFCWFLSYHRWRSL